MNDSCNTAVPRYLKDHTDLWRRSPREANLAWFKQADFGLFIHYGLYSQLARHEWVQYRERIPLAEYEKMFDTFRPEKFDADFLTDLALEAGMRYVNLVTCHHEGFCLWDSKIEPFNSVRACGRDLVAELAEQCDRKGLGFFAYFTHVLNWRHPWALRRERIAMARPDYAAPEPRYLATRDDQAERYWQWAWGCLDELAKMRLPLAGIWLDIIKAYYLAPDLVPVEKTYERLRAARPEALIAFKQGATGTEDFAAPEFTFRSLGDGLRAEGNDAAAARADSAWAINRHKHNEICLSLQHGGWGYVADSTHKTAQEVWGNLAYARMNDCNLLANVGPLPDGSIHPAAVAALREVGRRIRAQGLPGPDQAILPGTKTRAAGA